MNNIIIFIVSLLLIASFTVEYQLIKNNTPEVKKNRIRIRTWWIICAICMPIFYIGGLVLTFFVYSLIFWAVYEIFRLLNLQVGLFNVFLFSIILISYHFLTLSLSEYRWLFYLIPFIFLLGSFIGRDGKTCITTRQKSFIVIFSITSLFSIELIRQQSEGRGLEIGPIIIVLFFITSANDIFQYISGKKWGRHLLAPQISPHKTIEGALSGVILTAGVSMLVMPYVFNISFEMSAFIGSVIAILGIVGDLNISHLKRQAKVKDSGVSLPGHGGLLDRIDSLLLSAPGYGLYLAISETL